MQRYWVKLTLTRTSMDSLVSEQSAAFDSIGRPVVENMNLRLQAGEFPAGSDAATVLNEWLALPTAEARNEAARMMATQLNNGAATGQIDTAAAIHGRIAAQVHKAGVSGGFMRGYGARPVGEGDDVSDNEQVSQAAGRLGSLVNTMNAFASLQKLLASATLLAAPTVYERDYEDQVWFSGLGHWGERDTVLAASGFDWNGWGVLLGRTFKESNEWSWGFHGGYYENGVRQKLSTNRTDVDNCLIGVHGSYNHHDHHYTDASLTYTWNDYESRRNIAFGNLNRTANGDYDGREFSAYVETGWVYDVFDEGDVFIQPMIALNYRDYETDAYTETGAGALNLNVQDIDLDLFQTYLGLRIFRKYEADEGGMYVPDLVLRWAHEHCDVDRITTMSFQNSTQTFRIDNGTVDKDSLQVRAGVTGYTTENFDFDISYNGEYTDDQRAHSGVIQVVYSW